MIKKGTFTLAFLEDYRVEEITVDALLYGEIKLAQRRKGYRFSLDAILLADFVHTKATDRIIELGTGCGVIPLWLSRRREFTSILGVEIQPQLVRLARQNVSLNEEEERIQILECDLRGLPRMMDKGSYDVVICNPPYRKVASGRLNPDRERAIARHEICCTLEDVVRVTSHLLHPQGRFFAICLAERYPELMARLLKWRLSPIKVRFVHLRRGDKASHFLLEAERGLIKEFVVLPPLFVYQEGSEYSNEMLQIFRGR